MHVLLYIFSFTAFYNIDYMGPSCFWSYGSWMNKYLCNQCQSPLKLRPTWYKIMR